jgi:hypothetical protein
MDRWWQPAAVSQYRGFMSPADDNAKRGLPSSRKTALRVFFNSSTRGYGSGLVGRQKMKWAGMYFFGFVILVGGVVAALWKLGVLARIGTAWTVIGLAIVIGLGIMIAVANSGIKENIQIDRK